MDNLCKTELCTGCGACAAACPMDCIQMVPDSEGFLQPFVDQEACIGCNRCQTVCPILNQSPRDSATTTACAAINTDAQVRLHSTSGGVFSLLCQWVLDREGIVFGAAYGKDFRVVHCQVEQHSDLHKLQGAKYAQSDLGDTFSSVKHCLAEGRYVLFSGTPCQVAGLLSFLGKPYEKLILVDLICHGVPSPKVWQHYIDYRKQLDSDGLDPVHINLRSKETGWPGYSIRFDYPNGQFYSAPSSQDPYLRGFVGNLYLRQSCYDCHFKGSTRQSDFTLGDYWGVWSQLPEYHDGKGTSLVLLHSEKAKAIWEYVLGNCKYCEVDISSALKENPSALMSPPEKEKRIHYFDRYKQDDFSALVNELYPTPKTQKQSFIHRVAKKICNFIK